MINLPGPDLVEQVEALAPLTGCDPPAPHKADTFRFEPRKFQAVGLTPIAAETVKAPRIAQCPLQLEATVTAIHEPGTPLTANTSGSSRHTSSESTRTRASSSLEPTTSTLNTGVRCSTSSDTTSILVKRSAAASAPRTDS